MHMLSGKDYNELSVKTAGLIKEYIVNHRGALMCFAAGDTPLGVLRELIYLQQTKEIDLSSVYYAGLDEWVGLGPCDIGSCYQVMFDNFYKPAGIAPDHIHVFDGLDRDLAGQCAAMNKWIDERGGIGLALLGIGMNGHIGFNEPYTQVNDGAITVDLDDTTRSVSVKYFHKELPVDKGITIGLGALKKAQRVIIIASGEKKAEIIKQAISEPMSEALPASLFQDHPNITLALDEAAFR